MQGDRVQERASRQAVLELSVACAQGTAQADALTAAALPAASVSTILRLARAHGVEGVVLEALHHHPSLPFDPEVGQHRHDRVVRQLAAQFDLRQVADVLTDAGIPWIVVKGPVLTRLYAEPLFRDYDDIDVVVPQRSFRPALRALERAGAGLLDRDWERIFEERSSQLHLELSAGTVADLHWHLVKDARARRPVTIPMEDLFDRARTVAGEGQDLSTLDATDTLLHICLHTALDGGNRLRGLLDVERLLALDPPDWDLAVTRARAWRVGAPCAIVLARAARVAHAAVPDGIVDAMAESKLAVVVGRLLDTSHPEWHPEAMGPGTAWVRCNGSPGRRLAAALGACMKVPVAGGRSSANPSGTTVGRPSGSRFSRPLYLTWVELTAAGAPATNGNGVDGRTDPEGPGAPRAGRWRTSRQR